MTLCLHGSKDTLVAVHTRVWCPLLHFHRLSSGRSFGVSALIIASLIGSTRPARGRRTREAAGGLHTSSCALPEARATAATAYCGCPRVL